MKSTRLTAAFRAIWTTGSKPDANLKPGQADRRRKQRPGLPVKAGVPAMRAADSNKGEQTWREILDAVLQLFVARSCLFKRQKEPW
jgi:hypothetical protein